MTASEAAGIVATLARDDGWRWDGDAVAEPLGGGISNDVFAVQLGDRRVVLKTALPKLRVAADWRSDVERIHREAACQRWLSSILQPGEVPAVLWEDRRQHLYVMEHAPAEALNWKSEMLAGRVSPDAARQAGELLGRLHAAGADDDRLRAEFGDKQVFDQLRLDPYLREIARVHPDLHSVIQPLIDQLAGASETMVHGDYSPKNILVLRDHLVLLDHEVAHYGDSRFDLGFFFCHLTLKAIHVESAWPRLWTQLPTAWAAYRAQYGRWSEADWLPYLGAMLLARVDGKSPAEYLIADQQPTVRELAISLLRREITSLAGIA